MEKRIDKVGDTYNGFIVTKVEVLSEIQSRLIELTHKETQSRIMHIENDDSENVFCLAFQTLPNSSNGVAHILEHTVLCGSEKYPVKDPFFSMTRRSLNTFMNALTGQDFTCYPAASQVEQDFYNLLEVYLDAVFRPLLKRESFLQEGVRLEFEEPDDPKTPLQYKGIVFNEMKGALSNPTSRLFEAMSQALFPESPYGYNSGGDPKHIPELTYEELIAFHQKHYHPSRCVFFFYGNLPLEKHLDFLQENAFRGIKKATPLPPLLMQPRMKCPVYKEILVPESSEEDKDNDTIAFGWLTCPVIDHMSVLAITVLDIILMESDASLLKRELLNSGLCKQAYSYFDSEMAELPYVIVLKGCKGQDVEKLFSVCQHLFKKIISQGIQLREIESALHQLELSRSEITGNGTPYGLSLILRSGLPYLHGARAETSLMIHSLFEELRNKIIEHPTYFPELIEKYFVENTHCVRMLAKPTQTVIEEENKQECEELAIVQNSLTDEQKNELVLGAEHLERFQNTEDDDKLIQLLPKILLSDIPKKARHFSLNVDHTKNVEVYHHSAFTNNILYLDLVFPLPMIAHEDLWLVRLFMTILPQIGCGTRGYKENLDFIQENTGGVFASINFNHQAQDFKKFFPSFHLKSKSLYSKSNKLFELFFDFATASNFSDAARIKEIIIKHFTGIQSSLAQNALKYAISLASNGLSDANAIANQMFGLDYYHRLKELVTNYDKEEEYLLAKLDHFQKTLLCTRGADLVISSDTKKYNLLLEEDFYGLADIPARPFSPFNSQVPLKNYTNTAKLIASGVAFNAKVMNTVPYVHPDTPALAIACHLFDNVVLHKLIREQGGAYSSGASNSPMTGNLYFYSYRDPHIASTLNAFDEAVKTIVDQKYTDDDLDEAKREIIQSLDTPIAPGSRGEIAYGWMREGKTQEMRQGYRNAILEMKKEHVTAAVSKHVQDQLSSASFVTFAGKELVEKENSRLKKDGRVSLHAEKI